MIILCQSLETAQRFKFHSRYRCTGESIADFVSELQSVAELCNFGAYLDNMLRDCLVCGVVDERIQHCLLLEGTLTLKKCLLLLCPKRWHHAMPQFSNRPPLPLVLMLSRQTWMLTKYRHHVNSGNSQKVRANFCE